MEIFSLHNNCVSATKDLWKWSVAWLWQGYRINIIAFDFGWASNLHIVLCVIITTILLFFGVELHFSFLPRFSF